MSHVDVVILSSCVAQIQRASMVGGNCGGAVVVAGP